MRERIDYRNKEMNKDFRDIETPFYYYDTVLLQATLDAICKEIKLYPNFHVHYALKANANPKILPIIQRAGLGVDCVSGGEIQTAIDAHFPTNSIVYAGVGKTDKEIILGLRNRIFCFNVESIPELEVINELAAKENTIANVCLRINPDVEPHTHMNIITGMAENKFGIAMSDMEKVILLASTLPHIHFKGLHFHIGSQITQMGDFRALCERINRVQEWLEARGIQVEVINVGGGLGIDYQNPQVNAIPDFKEYFQTYAQYLMLRPNQSVHFELGRSIVAQCGTLITRVLYIKKGTYKQFAIVDAGMTDLIRPALYHAFHRIENISSSAQTYELYDVVGPICESSDIFDHDVQLPTTERGDMLAIRSAGAYGETMASTYNGRALPKSYTDKEI